MPTLATIKEAELSWLTLALVTITFTNGDIYRTATRAVTYGGNAYDGRTDSQVIKAFQAMDSLGIDRIGQVTLKLSHADATIWQNWEMSPTRGFKGGAVSIVLVGHNVEDGSFTSDSAQVFTGLCQAPDHDAEWITLPCVPDNNPQSIFVPTERVQWRCFKIYPIGAAAEADSVNEDSPFHACGHNPGIGRGIAGDPCDYTKESCLRLHMAVQGGAGAFSGINYTPTEYTRSLSYTEQKIVQLTNVGVGQRWGSPIPIPYGTTYVNPFIANTWFDGNSARMEVILCAAKLSTSGFTTDPGSVFKVICNGDEVPFVAYSGDKTIFRWQWVNDGSRDGRQNTDAGYTDSSGNPLGDWYGSQAVIEIVVPLKLHGSGIASVQVLLQGPPLKVYTGSGPSYSSSVVASDNPVWALFDMYRRARYREAAMDIGSFVTAAAIADAQINFVNQAGATVNTDLDGSPHKRFRISYSLETLKSASEVIAGMRNAIGAYVDTSSGKLAIRLKSTLAEQQPAPIAGSNTSTPIASTLRDGTTANGYPAYAFGPGSIAQDEAGKTTLTVSRERNPPNRFQYQFSNRDNGNSTDTLNDVDSLDVQLTGSENVQNWPVIGANTFDQNMRITSQKLAELSYGHPSGAPKGTLIYTWETSVRGLHLVTGQIVTLTDAHEGITDQQVRIDMVEAETDYRRMRLTARHHEGDWYRDSFGQSTSGQTASDSGRGPTKRPPFPWGPALIAPPTGDALFNHNDFTFDIEPNLSLTDGAGQPIPAISLNGYSPVNAFANVQPPIVVPQATITAGSTPFVGPISVWLAVCASDANGLLSAPSILARADIPTTASAITIKTPQWGPGTNGYSLFAGTDPRKLTLQASVTSSTPTTITLSSYFPNFFAMPDQVIISMRAETKRVIVPGVSVVTATASNSTTITVGTAAWTTNQWAGRVVTNLSTPAVANFLVSANTATVLTVTPNPVASGGGGTRTYSRQTGGATRFRCKAGDVLVIRAQPTIVVNGDGTVTLTDASWDLPATDNGVVNYYCRIVAGTGRGRYASILSNTATSITTGPFSITPDSTSVPIIEETAWTFAPRTPEINNSNPDKLIAIDVPTPNYAGSVTLVLVVTLNTYGISSHEELSPFRETWIAGSPGLQGNWSASTQWDLPAVGVDVGQGWAEVNNIQPGQSINLSGCRANVKTNPTGTFAAKWYVSRDQGATFTAILSANLQITAGNQNGQQTALAVTTLNYGDYLRLEVVSVGGAAGLDIALIGQVNN